MTEGCIEIECLSGARISFTLGGRSSVYDAGVTSSYRNRLTCEGKVSSDGSSFSLGVDMTIGTRSLVEKIV